MLVRVNPTGWGVGDKLTSAQANAIDVNCSSAIDKRAGQLDTLSSNVTCASGASFDFASGATCTVAAGGLITVAGNLTLASGGVLTAQPGSILAGVALMSDVLTAATGTWTCPPGIFWIEVHAWGGGGGGAGGAGGDATTPTTRTALGGGGGGGARRKITLIPVTPGSVYNYVVGTGGTGGAAVAVNFSGNNVGGDGADSTFNSIVVGRGAGGGNAPGNQYTLAASLQPCALGGKSSRTVAGPQISKFTIYSTTIAAMPEANLGEGGVGGGGTIGTIFSTDGGGSEGYAGGTRGATGNTATNLGGGGGGGGGAGPEGPGGNGGAGGNGIAAGVGGAGTAGVVGAGGFGTGAGGGGGGGGGEGSTTGGTGAAGGNGCSGKIIIRYPGPNQAVFT